MINFGLIFFPSWGTTMRANVLTWVLTASIFSSKVMKSLIPKDLKCHKTDLMHGNRGRVYWRLWTFNYRNKISTKWSGTHSTHGHVQASTSTKSWKLLNTLQNSFPFYFHKNFIFHKISTRSRHCTEPRALKSSSKLWLLKPKWFFSRTMQRKVRTY